MLDKPLLRLMQHILAMASFLISSLKTDDASCRVTQ